MSHRLRQHVVVLHPSEMAWDYDPLPVSQLFVPREWLEKLASIIQ